jgi:beta-1,4-mannosyltransferase
MKILEKTSVSSNSRKIRILAAPDLDTATGNPYVRLLYARMASAEVARYSAANVLLRRWDFAHFHWPETQISHKSFLVSVAKQLKLVGEIIILKINGTKVIWTTHNLAPHANYWPLLTNIFRRWFPYVLDGWISLSRAASLEAVRQLPRLQGKPVAIIPHGHYIDANETWRAMVNKKNAEFPATQNSNEPIVISLIGTIQPYKQADKLVTAYTGIANKARTKLVIAGKPSSAELARSLVLQCDNRKDIALMLGHLTDEDIAKILFETSVAVFPFSSILNSGSVLLALSFSCVVVAPRLGSLPELQEVVGSDWLRLYDGELKPENLEMAIEYRVSQCHSTPPNLSELDWERIGSETETFLRHLP